MIEASLLSLELIFLVLLGATFIGGTLAWSLRDSSGILNVLVGLPLVFSSLTYAFVFLSFFDERGLYEMRSIWGLSLILSLNLSPYMFFSLKLGFKSFSSSLKEALALSKNISALKKVMIYSKFLFPYWAVGFGFLSLEVLSEFGGSFLFGQETLSVYIYNLWLEQYNFSKAFGGFASLLILVASFFCLALYFQKKEDLSSPSRSLKKEKTQYVFPTIYTFLAVVFPIIFLTKLSFGSWHAFDYSKAISSFFLAFAVALFIFILFIVFNRGSLFPKKLYVKIPGLFYGVPGVLIGMMFYFLGLKIGFVSLVLALSLKYYKFLVDYVFSSWNSISYDSQSARSLIPIKAKQRQVDVKVSFSFLMVSFAMIFVEVLKELPITLMIKPVRFQTLSTEIFTLVSEGDWELAAPYGVVLFVFGFAALLINQFFINKADDKKDSHA